MSDKQEKAQEVKKKVEAVLKGSVSALEKVEQGINSTGDGLRNKFSILRGTEGLLLLFAVWTVCLQVYFYQYKFVDYDQPLLLSIGPLVVVAVIRVLSLITAKKTAPKNNKKAANARKEQKTVPKKEA